MPDGRFKGAPWRRIRIATACDRLHHDEAKPEHGMVESRSADAFDSLCQTLLIGLRSQHRAGEAQFLAPRASGGCRRRNEDLRKASPPDASFIMAIVSTLMHSIDGWERLTGFSIQAEIRQAPAFLRHFIGKSKIHEG